MIKKRFLKHCFGYSFSINQNENKSRDESQCPLRHLFMPSGVDIVISHHTTFFPVLYGI